MALFNFGSKYFDKNITPKCDYCHFGKRAKDGNKILCEKRGLVDAAFSCGKFSYSPLKRVPVKQLKFVGSLADDEIYVETKEDIAEKEAALNEEMAKNAPKPAVTNTQTAPVQINKPVSLASSQDNSSGSVRPMPQTNNEVANSAPQLNSPLNPTPVSSQEISNENIRPVPQMNSPMNSVSSAPQVNILNENIPQQPQVNSPNLNAQPIPQINNPIGNVPPVPPINAPINNAQPIPQVNIPIGNVPQVPPVNSPVNNVQPIPQPNNPIEDIPPVPQLNAPTRNIPVTTQVNTPIPPMNTPIVNPAVNSLENSNISEN